MSRVYLPRSFDYRSLETAASVRLSPQQISNHAITRGRCSLAAGAELALMKTRKMIPEKVMVIATGAKAQDDRGQASDPAAHALPCGISISGMGPVHLIPKSLSMREFIAQPYSHTNIVPRSVNVADQRAEAFSRKDGTGLVGSFNSFCQRILDTASAPRGILDKNSIRLAFFKLIDDYQQAFALALERPEPSPSGRFTFVPGLGMQVNADVPYTDKEFEEDNIRGALRGQMNAMREDLTFSPILLEQVESDFYESIKLSGE